MIDNEGTRRARTDIFGNFEAPTSIRSTIM
jgi:hypothetical protein